MRISDWSSDVCSSDLGRATADALAGAGDQGEPVELGDAVGQRVLAQIQRLEAPVERRGLRVQAQAVALLPGVLALQVLRREESALPPEHLSQSVHRLPVSGWWWWRGSMAAVVPRMLTMAPPVRVSRPGRRAH